MFPVARLMRMMRPASVSTLGDKDVRRAPRCDHWRTVVSDRETGIDRQRVRRVELAAPCAARKLDDAQVAVAVRDVDIAVPGEGDVGGAGEGLVVGPGLALDEEREQQLAG